MIDDLHELERDNRVLREELSAMTVALVEARGSDRDEIVTYLVKVPAQRGWIRWRKESHRTEMEALDAANKAAESHGRARVIERHALVRERIIHNITAQAPK